MSALELRVRANMKISILPIFILIALSAASYAQDQKKTTIDGLPVIEVDVAKTSVVIELYENQQLPNGDGISVFIRGWIPNDEISLSAIGPNEEKVSLLLPGKKLPVDSDGDVEFSITYGHKKLHPGKWVLVVEGASGEHGHYFSVPQH